MKKIFRFMMAAIAATAAMTACQQENLDPEVQEQEGVTVRIVASLSDETKAALSDEGYLKWNANDVVTARGYNSLDQVAAFGDGKILSVDEETNTAVYEFNGVPAGAKIWLGHNANGPSTHKFEFAKFCNAFSQNEAGEANPDYLMLVSEMIEVPADAEGVVELSAKMKIVGSLVRFLVYSSNGVDEQLKSVRMEVTDQNISGNNSGCLAYHFYPDGSYKYWAENNEESVTDTPSLFYAKDFKYTQTVLVNPYSLNGVTEPVQGSGIYLPVAPLSGTGYQYIVTTDKSTYFFAAPEGNYAFADNQLKNVLLNLDKATSKEDGVIVKDVKFAGSLAGEQTFEGTAISEYNLGYWIAVIDGADYRDWKSDLYKGVKFNCISEDDFMKGNFTTENQVDWLDAYFTNDGKNITDCTVLATLKANETGVERTAYIVLLWPELEQYAYPQGNMRTVKIIQRANVQISAVLSDLYETNISSAGETITAATLELTVDGEPSVDVVAAMTQYGVTVTADNGAIVNVAADGRISMTVPQNPYLGTKVYTLTVKHNDAVLESVQFTQNEGAEEAPDDVFSWSTSVWQKGHNGQYAVQFGANDLSTKHWLVVVDNLKKNGETPASVNNNDLKHIVMQILNITEEQFEAQPFIFSIDFGGAGESKILISMKEANTTGQMIVYEGDIYEPDHSSIVNHYTINHLAN